MGYQTALLRQLNPLDGYLGGQGRLKFVGQLSVVDRPRALVAESLVVNDIGLTDGATQLFPVFRNIHADYDLPIEGQEGVRRLGVKSKYLLCLIFGSLPEAGLAVIWVSSALFRCIVSCLVCRTTATLYIATRDDVRKLVALAVEQRRQRCLGQHVTAGVVDELEQDDLRFAVRCGHPGGDAGLGGEHNIDAWSVSMWTVATEHR